MRILYVIHTSPKRIKFVEEYMVPCFKRYGIEDIMVWNDEQFKGQLKAWTECALWIIQNKQEYDGCWHLEDDVIPCKDFKFNSEQKALDGMIVQGFVTNNKFSDFKGDIGILPVNYLPYGMQCIYIPNYYLKGFIYFMEEYVITGKYHKRQYDCGTLWSDNVFRGFLRHYCPNTLVNILDECMVEHIDYLIGGRSVRAQKTQRRAVKFNNYEEVQRLEAWVREEDYNGTTED